MAEVELLKVDDCWAVAEENRERVIAGEAEGEGVLETCGLGLLRVLAVLVREAVGANDRDAAGLPDMDGELLLLVEAQCDAVAAGERALVAETLTLRVTLTLAVVEREGIRDELAQLDAEARIVDDLEPSELGVTLRVAEMDSVAQGLREDTRDAEGQLEGEGKGEAVSGAVGEWVTKVEGEIEGLAVVECRLEGDKVPEALPKGVREALGQLDAEESAVGDQVRPVLGETLSVALGQEEGKRDEEGQREKDGKGEALRGAGRERVREGKEDSVRETVGERVAEVLQVGGEMLPGAEQAPGQGQGRGAVRAGVGQ